MARKQRRDFPQAWHHVMHRGARRAPIFVDDSHCDLFLGILADLPRRFGIEIHAYALMPNHYHLLLRSVQGNLSVGMRHLNALYAQRLNALCRWDGPLFRGRFANQVVYREEHLRYLVAYIHLNPLRANLVTRLDSDWWTSYRAYVGVDSAPPWLTCERMLAAFGGRAGLIRFVEGLHRKRRGWPNELSLEAGWFKKLDEPPNGDGGSPTQEGRFNSALDVLRMVSQVTGASLGDLQRTVRGPRANPARRFCAWALSRHARLTHAEVGRHLEMTTNQVGNVLRRIELRCGPMSDWQEALAEVMHMTSDGS